MQLHTWWLFVIMTFFVSATPGPNMLLVMSMSARHGVAAAVATMAGCMCSLMAMMGLSAAGLGALLQSFPAIFDTLRLTGAAYLAYLGVCSWRAEVREPAAGDTLLAQAPSESPAALFRRGVLVAASNPKAILFAAAFLPQFIHTDSARLPQFAILLGTFAVIEISWYFIYAFGGQRLSAYLRQASVLRAFNRLTGAAFIGFAGVMAFVKE